MVAKNKRIDKQKALVKKINKSIKNKSSLKNCENFCKKDYIVEINKQFKRSSKKYNILYKLPTATEKIYAYNTCKKTFCNKKCEGYEQIDFNKKITDGFQNTYSKDKVEMLKKRGALFGCVDMVDYNVFHK